MDTSAITAEWAMAEMIKNPSATKARFLTLTIPPMRGERIIQAAPSYASNASSPIQRKIRGNYIPKGSNVHVNVWAVARDPAVWKNPLEFRPERFLEENVDMKGHDFRLLSFGARRQACPGAHLGINLVTSMMNHLLHHFVWTPPQEAKPEKIDMSENPGLVTYMRTPVHAVATLHLPSDL
ncbi:hypothetical protein EUTSA_v10017706mg [Eutrema salsugineum]|uniref:Cytochrome P450 n=1 Tax=Eutrema salsugineum TaxID=72664 RepID=V4LQE5_EUTSA|nr:hypothetical protein EUTSA_v10017706mg [Eutrema salsugineum]